jgi:hypothetical protein
MIIRGWLTASINGSLFDTRSDDVYEADCEYQREHNWLWPAMVCNWLTASINEPD